MWDEFGSLIRHSIAVEGRKTSAYPSIPIWQETFNPAVMFHPRKNVFQVYEENRFVQNSGVMATTAVNNSAL